MSAIAQLKSIPLLSTLDADTLAALAGNSVLRQHRKKTIVLSQGDDTGTIYFVVAGKVRVFRDDEHGNEVTLNILQPGHYFGELALLSDEPRVANVETLESTTLISISRTVFMHHLSDNADIAWQMCRDLIEKMRAATLNVSSFALLDVHGRVARVLQKRAQRSGDNWVVDKLTHQDIAHLVGASRETVSRIIKDMRSIGQIETDGRKIILLNLPAE